MIKLVLFLVTILFLISCGDSHHSSSNTKKEDTNISVVGGKCSYDSYLNKIEIISIEELTQNNSKKRVKIEYEIIQKAPNLPISPKNNITYNVSKEYLIEKGFDIGTLHDLNISIIKSGTCTPVIEQIVGLNEADFIKGEKG